jgi:hypothetical protein
LLSRQVLISGVNSSPNSVINSRMRIPFVVASVSHDLRGKLWYMARESVDRVSIILLVRDSRDLRDSSAFLAGWSTVVMASSILRAFPVSACWLDRSLACTRPACGAGRGSDHRDSHTNSNVGGTGITYATTLSRDESAHLNRKIRLRTEKVLDSFRERPLFAPMMIRIKPSCEPLFSG